ncbi:MAG TPA: tetratricopeptide repeat protein [Novosphingobium sp.]|nr:tetratricopeptide repeat protein [Novosphingobium sp.]
MPDRPGNRHLCWLAAIALAALVPAAVVAGPPAAERLIGQAQGALNRGEGVAAEMRLRDALAAGAGRAEVAAAMGDAYIQQGNLAKAREWLGPGEFVVEQQAYGFRTLGLLERFERNLPAAGKAYDRALKLEPNNSMLWVDIARLRYLGGEHLGAIGAAERALELDPGNVRALEFRGQLVLDQFGLAAALPWFEAALVRAPDDSAILAEYAAMLGELGRAHEMLVVTRRILERDPRNPHAFFLQATLAARAGKSELARSLLKRTGSRLDGVPAALLLGGVLELEVGNTATARDLFERLLRQQPANPRAALLVARTLYSSHAFDELIDRFAPLAARPDASPYLLTLVARAYEEREQRDLAASLLDRAAAAVDPPVQPIPEAAGIGFLAPRWADAPYDRALAVPYVRALLGAGQYAQAEAVAERMRAAKPGSGDIEGLAGDVQLALRRGPAAVERYRAAATVRLTDDLLLRMFSAFVLAGQGQAIGPMANNYLAMNPQNRLAARVVASGAAATGDWSRSRLMLENLRARSGGSDVRLLSDLALAKLREGDKAGAFATAQSAYRLQRASPVAAQAYAMALIANGRRDDSVRRLLDKAQASMGSNPLLVEARRKLVGK